jgi:RNA polymerase sigma factor (TIGR02999 family)
MASEIILLLQKLRDGDRAALDELTPLVYGELRHIAQAFMRRQRAGHTLQPTALVHEAFIKLFEADQAVLADRAHLLALMARVMRQILVDHARAQAAAKRGGGEQRVTLNTSIEVVSERGVEPLEVLALHDALDALAAEDAGIARLVEMHYFGGMTAEETALVAGRSAHAVRHDLRYARAWLRRRLA